MTDKTDRAREWVLKCRTCKYCDLGTRCTAHDESHRITLLAAMNRTSRGECPYFEQRRPGLLRRLGKGLGLA